MLKYSGIFFIALTLALLGSCSSPIKQTDYLNSIIPADSSMFRGMQLGISQEESKRIEKGELSQQTADALEYSVKADSLNAEIEYGFDENELNEISCNLFPQSEQVANKVYDDLLIRYRKKYGEPVSEKGYLSWITKDKAPGFIARILITTDVGEKNLPVINISIYRDIE